jgi:predicted ATP-grasp superfamily ATP-dependent carboligase
VEAIRTRGKNGPATLVKVVEGKEMLEAARVIAQSLGMSGFFGLDFVIENATRIPYLIEINPRCTPPCAIPFGATRNLVVALCGQLAGRISEQEFPEIKEELIAYFPQNPEDLDLNRSYSDSVYVDVPQEEPEFVEELLRPGQSRTALGRLVDRMRRQKQPDIVSVPTTEVGSGSRSQDILSPADPLGVFRHNRTNSAEVQPSVTNV